MKIQSPPRRNPGSRSTPNGEPEKRYVNISFPNSLSGINLLTQISIGYHIQGRQQSRKLPKPDTMEE